MKYFKLKLVFNKNTAETENIYNCSSKSLAKSHLTIKASKKIDIQKSEKRSLTKAVSAKENTSIKLTRVKLSASAF